MSSQASAPSSAGAAAAAVAKDKKISKKHESLKPYDIKNTEFHISPILSKLVLGGGLPESGGLGNKFTHCSYHHVLPWVAFCPKHALEFIVWDTETEKVINSIHLVDLLAAQKKNKTASGAPWTPELIGNVLSLSFVDGDTLMWQRHMSLLNVSREKQEGNPIDCENKDVFGLSGPEFEVLAEEAMKSKGGKKGAPGQQKNKAASSDVFNPSAASQHQTEVSLLIVTELLAMFVSVGTGKIHQLLLSSDVSNRHFTASLMCPVLSSHRPLLLLGCNDGCLVTWDPYAPRAPKTTPLAKSGFAGSSRESMLPSFPGSVIMTPHKAKINDIAVFYLVNPPKGSNAGGESLQKAAEGTSSLQGCNFCVVIGTEGGSLSKITFKNRDEIKVDFSCKKQHDNVLSVCVKPIDGVDRHTDNSEKYCAEGAIEEFLNAVAAKTQLFSLGSKEVLLSDGQTGAEVRRIKIKGVVNSPITQLLPGFDGLYLVSNSYPQYRMNYEMTSTEDITYWCSLCDVMKRAHEHLPPAQHLQISSTSVAFISAGGAAALTTNEGTGESAGLTGYEIPTVPNSNFKVYSMFRHPLKPMTKLAFCTNMGLLLLDLHYGFPNRVFMIPSHVSDPLGTNSKKGTICSETFVTLCEDGKVISLTMNLEASHFKYLTAAAEMIPLIAEIAKDHQGTSSFGTGPKISDSIVTNKTIITEPTGGMKVASLWPSPCKRLLAVLTHSRDLMLFDATRNFAPLTVPVMPRADEFAWSSTSTAFAVLCRDTKKVCVASIKIGVMPQSADAPARNTFQVLPTTHDIAPSNTPLGISGGRWLCVHYEASFAGLSSQFFRWESSAVGGGAVGTFLPQPSLIKWDASATLCAMCYPTVIVFMEAKRKVFSKLSSVELSSEPHDVMFYGKCLFVVLEREILLLLPTPTIVQKVLIASINPSVATNQFRVIPVKRKKKKHDSDETDEDEEEAAAKKGPQIDEVPEVENLDIGSFFTYRALVRPPSGRLTLLGVQRHDPALYRKKDVAIDNSAAAKVSLSLFVSDENNEVFVFPLTSSVAQLLLCIHGYQFPRTTTPSEREIVNACCSPHATSSAAAAASNLMFVDAVLQFCRSCGLQLSANETKQQQHDEQQQQQQDGAEATAGGGGGEAHDGTSALFTLNHIGPEIEEILQGKTDGDENASAVATHRAAQKLLAAVSARTAGSWMTKGEAAAVVANTLVAMIQHEKREHRDGGSVLLPALTDILRCVFDEHWES